MTFVSIVKRIKKGISRRKIIFPPKGWQNEFPKIKQKKRVSLSPRKYFARRILHIKHLICREKEMKFQGK